MVSPKTYRQLDFIQNNIILFVVSLVIIIVERLVKAYITLNLEFGEKIPAIGNILSITRTYNTGAAFGILKGLSWLFIIVSIVVIVMIVIYYHKIIYDAWLVFACAFIIAGTVGNTMDRLFFGHVIDYISLSFWPTFNLSDMSLCAGVIILCIKVYLWESERKEKPKEPVKLHESY